MSGTATDLLRSVPQRRLRRCQALSLGTSHVRHQAVPGTPVVVRADAQSGTVRVVVGGQGVAGAAVCVGDQAVSGTAVELVGDQAVSGAEGGIGD